MRPILVLLCSLALAIPAAQAAPPAPRVFSLTDVTCSDCAGVAAVSVRKLKGVKRATLDRDHAELTVIAGPGVTDAAILRAIETCGRPMHAVAGAGQGAYLPFPEWPEGVDAQVLARSGESVGPLEPLCVAGKWTVFDVYADWCGPCRSMDATLLDVAQKRSDVAVRKLNVKNFDTPLARELGPGLRSLPHVIVFSPDGRRTELEGADLAKLEAALAAR